MASIDFTLEHKTRFKIGVWAGFLLPNFPL